MKGFTNKPAVARNAARLAKPAVLRMAAAEAAAEVVPLAKMFQGNLQPVRGRRGSSVSSPRGDFKISSFPFFPQTHSGASYHCAA